MNTLITPDEVIRFFPGNSIDPNIFASVIFEAEQRFAVPVIGYQFYQQLCTQKNVMVNAGNIDFLQQFFSARNITLTYGSTVNAIDLLTVQQANAALWNNALWPYLAKCVYFAAMPANYAKFSSSGIVKNNPSPTFLDSSSAGTSSGISLADLKYLRDDVLLQSISVLEDSLKAYLSLNSASFPLVPNTCRQEEKPSRKSGLVFIYEDDDDDCHDRRRDCRPNNNQTAPAVVPDTNYMTCSITALIKTDPDATATYMLCNMQSIPAEYAPGNTLVLPNLIKKYVTGIMTLNGNPVTTPFNSASGTFDNTANGGFNDGDVFIFLYNEKMS
jgi:hypothetical protein